MTANKKLNQFIALTKSNFRTYLEIVISIFLFILFFQPFAVEKIDYQYSLLFNTGFGLIVLVSLFISQVIFQGRLIQIEAEMKTNSISIPLYFFTQVVTTSLGFIFYIRYVGQNNITFNTVARVFFICISLPVTIYIKNRFVSYRARIKKLLLESYSIQDKLKQFTESYSNKHIEIISENDSDNFRIQVSEIVYVKSADNYVEIGYHDEGAVKKRMIRNTLRNIEQQLVDFNNFTRTHRSSLVNIQYIDKLNKNFNTYWLSLNNTKETVPVSRQYLMSVKDLL